MSAGLFLISRFPQIKTSFLSRSFWWVFKEVPKFAIWRTYASNKRKYRCFCVFFSTLHLPFIHGPEVHSKTNLSADPWRGGMSSISRADSVRDAVRSRGRLAPSETRRCEPGRSAPSGGGAEERILGFPFRWEPINPKSKVKSGGTEGFQAPRCK